MEEREEMINLLQIIDKELIDIIESMNVLCNQAMLSGQIENDRFVRKADFLLRNLDEIIEILSTFSNVNVELIEQYEIYREKFICAISLIAGMNLRVTTVEMEFLVIFNFVTLKFRGKLLSEIHEILRFEH